MSRRALRVAVALLSIALPVRAEEIRVAVASNFTAAREISRAFEATTEHRATLVFGSTGKHYAQIVHGAPFQVFLAADAGHPERLESSGLAVPGSRFVYAVGHLILWSPDSGVVDPQGRVLAHGDFRHLAIANPRLAPYGRAARQVLEALDLWERVDGRLVQGENIAQTFQFVDSGNAELGFVAASQLALAGEPTSRGSLWEVPRDLHEPIEQQAVLLAETPGARAFTGFLQGAEARAVIRAHGYSLP